MAQISPQETRRLSHVGVGFKAMVPSSVKVSWCQDSTTIRDSKPPLKGRNSEARGIQ